MKFFLLLIPILFIIFSSGCNREEDAFKPVYCSPTNQYAPCEDPSQSCYNGKCILSTLKCGGTIDAFCDNGDECRRDDSLSREYKCFEGKCSIKNKDGYCINKDETCYNGLCNKPCSEDVPRGGCEDSTETCFDSVCLPRNNLCKTSNPNGKCNPNNKCVKSSDGRASCVRLCHILEGEENPEYDKMPCMGDGETCIEGECLHDDNMCSNDKPDGECPSFQICTKKEDSNEFKCENKCASKYPKGICLGEDQACVNGVCDFACSINHPEGYCDNDVVGETGGCELGDCKKECGNPDENPDTILDGYCKGVDWCQEGNCVPPCDINHKEGICEDENDYCNNGLCEKRACSEQFPNGYCDLAEDDSIQKCVENTCVKKCSQEESNGWCESGSFCYAGSCKVPSLIPCEEENGTHCTDQNFECIAKECVLKPCSIGFAGRCNNPADVCYTVTGECFSMCADYRRILCSAGETPEVDGCINQEDMPDSSPFSACCANNEDCQSQGENIATSVNNRCINDQNSLGSYCNSIGTNACNNDEDCNDSYPYLPNEGSVQKYYCSYYYDEVESINISFCKRAKEGCNATRDKTEGQYCDQSCGDADCIYGTHCIDGICTSECNQNTNCPSVHSGKQLNCLLYSEERSYPGYSTEINSNICRSTCTSNKDCKLSQNDCNNYLNKKELNNNLPLFSTCGNKKEGSPKNTVCNNDDECSSRLCVKNKCSEPCAIHEDCGTNAYCDYNKGLVKDSETINYMGVCRYLAPGTSRKAICQNSSECLVFGNVTVNGIDRAYKCLPYTDNQDVVRGVCGMRDIVEGGVSKEEWKPCNSPNQHCDTEICIKVDSVGLALTPELTTSAGTCAELCSETSECNDVLIEGVTYKQFCKRMKFRDGALTTGNNREVFGGICIPAPLSTLTDCSVNSCSSQETCILNPVNTHNDSSNPWKFSVEYLCVYKNLAGRDFGVNCDNDSQCKSQICSKLTNKCVTACKNDTQCTGLGSETCNTAYPAVYDISESNWILGGVCE